MSKSSCKQQEVSRVGMRVRLPKQPHKSVKTGRVVQRRHFHILVKRLIRPRTIVRRNKKTTPKVHYH